MKNIFNKTNAPYLVAGALATLALVSSEVVGVLTAVAVFNASLPLIAGLVSLAVFSAATIAFSAVMISKNNIISQQEKFESRVAQRKREEANERAKLKDEGKLPDVIALPYKNFESRVAERKKEEANERAKLKDEGKLPDVITLPYKDDQGWVVWGKEKARNWIPSLKTAGWIAGGAGLLATATYIAANRGLGVAGNSSNAVGNSTNSTESGVSISNSSSVYYRPTDQQIKQSQIYEASKKLADPKKFAENNFGISEEDEPQWSKDLHKSETTEEIMDGDTLSNLFYEGNNSGYQFATSNVTEPARISETVGSNQTTIPDNVTVSQDKYAEREFSSVDGDNKSTFANLSSASVGNGINTSKQQGTFIDSVELKKLTKALPTLAYHNGSPRIL